MTLDSPDLFFPKLKYLRQFSGQKDLENKFLYILLINPFLKQIKTGSDPQV